MIQYTLWNTALGFYHRGKRTLYANKWEAIEAARMARPVIYHAIVVMGISDTGEITVVYEHRR